MLAVPGEITTIAAQRLKERVALKTKAWGIEKIIISSFANAYMGYITTPEEYALQCYEGGHTVYGQHTLAAIIDGFEKLIMGQLPEIQQHQFPSAELKLRSV
jgi:neutral ceramidase